MSLRMLCVILLAALAGCGASAGGKLMVDTPVLPYVAPDISEITGIDEPEEPEERDAASAPASAAELAAPTATPEPKK